MTILEAIHINQTTDDDWRCMLNTFSDVKIAEIVGCTVDSVKLKRLGFDMEEVKC